MWNLSGGFVLRELYYRVAAASTVQRAAVVGVAVLSKVAVLHMGFETKTQLDSISKGFNLVAYLLALFLISVDRRRFLSRAVKNTPTLQLQCLRHPTFKKKKIEAKCIKVVCKAAKRCSLVLIMT